jgi:hypothetical protein
MEKNLLSVATIIDNAFSPAVCGELEATLFDNSLIKDYYTAYPAYQGRYIFTFAIDVKCREDMNLSICSILSIDFEKLKQSYRRDAIYGYISESTFGNSMPFARSCIRKVIRTESVNYNSIEIGTVVLINSSKEEAKLIGLEAFLKDTRGYNSKTTPYEGIYKSLASMSYGDEIFDIEFIINYGLQKIGEDLLKEINSCNYFDDINLLPEFELTDNVLASLQLILDYKENRLLFFKNFKPRTYPIIPPINFILTAKFLNDHVEEAFYNLKRLTVDPMHYIEYILEKNLIEYHYVFKNIGIGLAQIKYVFGEISDILELTYSI